MSRQIVPDYEIVGDGEQTIVFIHYFGGDSGSWAWLVKRLRKNYRCVLLNLPGFGGTRPFGEPSIFEFSKYINQCVEELQLTDYMLCGHSMGGKLALYAATINEGQKPKKILLVAPSPPTTEDMPKAERDRMLKHPDAAESLTSVKNAIKKKLGKKKFAYAIESQLRVDENTWAWWLTKGMKNDVSKRISNLDIPVHVIFSKGDPVITPEAIYEEVLPHLKKPSFVAFGKVGHLIPMESPRKLARQIKKATQV